MNDMSESLVFGTVPEAVRQEAMSAGLDGERCLFAVCTDLTLDGRAKETWLVVTERRAIALVPGEGVAAGPFVLRDVEKVRAFQTVGSAFLQFSLDGLYMSAVRYSNALRETFGRVRLQLDRLVCGDALQPEALTASSERLCSTCGLPLPGRKAACPRCQARRGIFRRTLALMKPYRTFTVLLVSMMLVGVGLDLIPPLLTRAMVDKVLVPRTNAGWLPWILLGLVATSSSRYALNIFIGRTSSLIGTRITKELRERLQSRLLEASVDYYDRHSPGGLMSRVLYDVDQFQGFVVQVAQGFLLNLMLVLGIGTVLFLMNWRLALLVLLPIPFVIAGTTFFWRHIYPRYYKLWDSQSKMAQLLTGLLSGIRLVKSFAQEDREKARFQTAAGYMRDSRRDVEMSVATFNPVMAFVFGLGGLIIWYVGGHLVLKEALSLGTLVAFIGYSAMFYAPISSLSMFSNWATGFLTAGQRVFEVLDITSGVNEDPDPVHIAATAGAIEFRGVTFGYDPTRPC